MSIALVEVQVFSLAPRQKGNNGALAERLRGGLQNLKDGFDSRTCLHISLGEFFYSPMYFLTKVCASGGIGRREGLKIP